MIEFINKNWTYIVAFGTVAAFLFEKGRTYWMESKKKKVAYNRIFTSVVKLYLSYLKHKSLYTEKSPFGISDEIYNKLLKFTDTFNKDLDEFKNSVDKESEIIPELIIQTNMLFEIIDRMRIIDRMSESDEQILVDVSEKQKVGVRKAQFYALEKVFTESFDEILKNLRKHTSVKKSFIKDLQHFESKEYEEKSKSIQFEVFQRYLESLINQGIFPQQEIDTLKENANIK